MKNSFITATKVFEFEMGHVLESAYSEECTRPGGHGHSYRLEVTFKAEHLNKDGMVIDFKLLKEIVAPIVKRFDHAFLKKGETCDYNPTAENMAAHIGDEIWMAFTSQSVFRDTRGNEPSLYKVRLWETRTAYIDYYL